MRGLDRARFWLRHSWRSLCTNMFGTRRKWVAWAVQTPLHTSTRLSLRLKSLYGRLSKPTQHRQEKEPGLRTRFLLWDHESSKKSIKMTKSTMNWRASRVILGCSLKIYSSSTAIPKKSSTCAFWTDWTYRISLTCRIWATQCDTAFLNTYLLMKWKNFYGLDKTEVKNDSKILY